MGAPTQTSREPRGASTSTQARRPGNRRQRGQKRFPPASMQTQQTRCRCGGRERRMVDKLALSAGAHVRQLNSEQLGQRVQQQGEEHGGREDAQGRRDPHRDRDLHRGRGRRASSPTSATPSTTCERGTRAPSTACGRASRRGALQEEEPGGRQVLLPGEPGAQHGLPRCASSRRSLRSRPRELRARSAVWRWRLPEHDEG